METTVVKRSVVVKGHKTSISLEDQFWAEIKAIACERKLSVSELVSVVDHDRGEFGNLSSALRTFVLKRYLAPTAEPQHATSHQEPQLAVP